MTFVAPVQIAPVLPPVVRPIAEPFAADAGALDGIDGGAEAGEVASKRTPMSLGGIRQALATAYQRANGAAIPAKMLDILSAHVAHETARGDRMFNFNFGGIKGTGPSGLTAKYQTTEVLGGETKKLVDGFRAYRTAAEGASDYLKLLQDRFPGALREAKSGDVVGFAASLKHAGYFTADLDAYTKAMQAHVHAIGAARSSGSGLAAYAPSRGLPTSADVARIQDAMGGLSTRLLADAVGDGGFGR